MDYSQKLTKKAYCRTCRHFRLHYIKYKSGYYHPIDYGHCVYPRIKNRDGGKPACPHYQQIDTKKEQP